MAEEYDIIIIGGGAGGLTAAIYASRELHKTLLVEKQMTGGLASTTHLMENYPGFPEGVGGADLIKLFRQQAERFGTEIREFIDVKALEKLDDGRIAIHATEHHFVAKAVIIATGSFPRKIGVPGEKEFYGRGVSYCATCDGAFFRDMDVAVVGCGNSGLQEGQVLLEICKTVSFIEFLDYIPAEKILYERVEKAENSRCYVNHKVVRIEGDQFVEKIIAENRATGEEVEIPSAGVFIYAGYKPNSDYVQGFVEMDDRGYIITDADMKTSVPGVFAVGDVRSKRIQQVTVATADGTIAAIMAGHYLREL
ncbi:MAG: NAD(P)/FAD-dependent oxidoreductase [bacterium]